MMSFHSLRCDVIGPICRVHSLFTQRESWDQLLIQQFLFFRVIRIYRSHAYFLPRCERNTHLLNQTRIALPIELAGPSYLNYLSRIKKSWRRARLLFKMRKCLVKIVTSEFDNLFDCCKQSLTRLHHPSRTILFLHKKGVTGSLLYWFAPILCKSQDRLGPLIFIFFIAVSNP